METRMQKLAPKLKSRKHKYVIRTIIMIFLLFICGAVLLIATPQGNTVLHKAVPSMNTPVDNVVKKQVVDKIKTADIDNKDKEKLTSLAKEIPMSKVADAAKNPTTAATLYAQYTGKDKASARDAIDVIYSDSRLKDLRNDIANSHWINAYKEYNKLEQNNTIEDIADKAVENSNNSAQNAQKQASKDYNAAVSNDSITTNQEY